jgi:hypothetical protein
MINASVATANSPKPTRMMILLPKPFNFDGVKAVLDKLLAARRTRESA